MEILIMSRQLTLSSLCISLLLLCTGAFAQDGKMYPIDPPAEPNAIALNTGGVDQQKEKESWFRQWDSPMARNISTATLTPFLANPEKANGTSVIVAPGGGFMWLSLENEGWKVAQALADRGINAFVIKYRLKPTAATLEGFESEMTRLFAEAGDASKNNARRPGGDLSHQLKDVEAAYALMLSRADEWGVNKDKVGMVGFSAGAALTMATALESKKVKLSFIAPIYGGMGAVDVPKNAPPLFAAIATDDFLFHGDAGLIKSWYDAGIPVEFHLYQNGGHGFGLGYPDRTSNQWFEAFMHWLNVNKFVQPK